MTDGTGSSPAPAGGDEPVSPAGPAQAKRGLGDWFRESLDAGALGPFLQIFGLVYGSLDRRLGLRGSLAQWKTREIAPHVNVGYCFGGLAFALLLVQMLTGMFLAVYYKAAPDEAYESVRFLMTDVTLGWLARGLHRWAGEGLILLMGIHVLRVFFTGSFKNPREFNWVVGAVVLLLVLGFRFTGQLLPWDQTAYWSTIAGIEVVRSVPLVGPFMLSILWGGETIDGLTLGRFYTAHVVLLPWLVFFLLALHFLMVRRQGISRPL